MYTRSNSFSLLFPEGNTEFVSQQPVFFGDLQMEGILKAILSRYSGFDLQKFFYTIPGSVNTIRYRQDIYRDLEKNDFLILVFKRVSDKMVESETCYQYFRQMEDEIKRGSYLLMACRHYLAAFKLLRDSLEKADIASKGFQALQEILDEMNAKREFVELSKLVETVFSYMDELKLTLLLSKKEIRIVEDESLEDAGVVDRIYEFMKAFEIPVQKAVSPVVENIFPSPLETSSLETAVVDILRKSRPEIFRELKRFADVPFTLEENIFLKIKNEIVFYISFYEFEKQLKKAGYQLEYPEIRKEGGESSDPDSDLELIQVYDMALAWKNRFSGEKVVKNDVCYGRGKSFLVITGPNQGGKTTLARAVGQCVYLMLMGLKAPCHSMRSRFFERIMTHFEVEESVKTGAGKLKEELRRLKPMMQDQSGNQKNSFVILNELFTTATTYDARIMAQKVMEHFQNNKCLGIYVTHIRELADEKNQPGIQSMVAQVDQEDPGKRTFLILPMEAQGLGYSDSIVKKYGLDYNQIAERVAALNYSSQNGELL